jgi:hypothetical protein
MNGSASLVRESVIALGIASLVLVVAGTVAIRLLRRKLVG